VNNFTYSYTLKAYCSHTLLIPYLYTIHTFGAKDECFIYTFAAKDEYCIYTLGWKQEGLKHTLSKYY